MLWAALAAVGAASAQSSVTISGLVRAGFQKEVSINAVNPDTAKGGSAAPSAQPTIAGKGLATTDININFSGTEDLGGGLRASFFQNLETDPQRGAALQRADSGLSLGGGFGTLAYTNTRNSDQIASIGSSAIILADNLYHNTGIVTRSNIDVLTYTAPAIMGVVTSLSYVENNNGQINIPTTNRAAYVLGAAYTAGPLVVRASYKGKPSNVTASSGLTPKANFELAALYDLGVARVGVAYDAASVEGTSNAAASSAPGTLTQPQAQRLANLQTKSATGFSLHVPMGAASFGLGFYKRGDQKVTDVGVRYDLSKRTYLSAARSEKKGLFNADGYGGGQYRVAMTHSF